MTLPISNILPIHLLSQCFNETSATYKFYWFLSVLHEVEKGNLKPAKRHVFAGMVARAWYTVNYFHVSFGKQDKLQRAILSIKETENLTVDAPVTNIFDTLNQTDSKNTIQELYYFNKEVPWRFLSPWIKGNERAVYKASQNFENDSLYALYPQHIEVNPKWESYLVANAGILKSFCYWKLSMYLQKHNPNVPDISSKLIKPAKRNNLNGQRKFWNFVITELGPVKCIYTRNSLNTSNFAVEHFIPYAFVSHDLMWNLIPADKAFNCSKNDRLPHLDRHFDDFFELQKSAIELMSRHAPQNKFLSDYLSIFPDLTNISRPGFKDKYRETLQPLITIASNNGFSMMK